MRPGIRAKLAFASTTLLLSLLFALPSAKSAEESRLLYLDVDTADHTLAFSSPLS